MRLCLILMILVSMGYATVTKSLPSRSANLKIGKWKELYGSPKKSDNFHRKNVGLNIEDQHFHYQDILLEAENSSDNRRNFKKDRAAVVSRALQAGVKCCLVNTECVDEFQKTLDLANEFPNFCAPCFGVHPVQYDITDSGPVGRSASAKDLESVEDWFSKHSDSLIAIGETGLDFTPRYIHSDGDKDAQRDVLKFQIELSKKYDLPLICHSRSSGKPVISLLQQNGASKVLLHAFDGNAKSAMPGIQAGYYFSMPPSSLRSEQKKLLIAKIPMEQLLLETDSPVLGPNKDERNEPANITISAQVISEIKKIDVKTVIQITTENAYKLFPRLKSFVK